MSSILSRARPLVLARGFSAGVTFLIPLVLARHLEVAEYGSFKQFFLVSHTLYFMLLLGIPQALYYFLPRAGPDEQRAYVGQSLVYLGLAGIVAALGLLSAEGLLAFVGGPALVELRVPIAVYTGLYLGAAPLEVALTSRGRPGAAAAITVVSDVCRSAAYLLPAMLGQGLAGVMWGAVVFGGLRLATAWVSGLQGRGPIFTWSTFKRHLRYALPFGGAMLLAIPQQQFHQYVVSTQVDPAVFALYAVGVMNLPIVDLLYTPASELLMVQLGEIERGGRPAEEALTAFREVASQLAYVFLPVAAGLAAIAPWFLGMLYGAPYVEAAPIFRLAVIPVALSCLPLDGVLRGRGHTRALFLTYLAKAVVSVPLVLALFRGLGPIGAMVGFVSAEIVHKGVLLVQVARVLAGPGLPLHRALRLALPLPALARAGGAALSAGLVVLAGSTLAPAGPVLAALVLGGTFWLLYLGALVAAGVRPAALFAFVRR